MGRKKTTGSKGYREDKLFDFAIYLISTVILIIVLYPLVFVLSASFSDPEKVITGQMWLWPKGFTWEPYTKVFENQDIWTGYWNSIRYTVIGTVINLVMTILAAYPLSRRDLGGRNFFMFLFAFTMFFSGGLIPTYLVVRNLGLLDSMWALILPGAISTVNLIIMRTYFQTSIPMEVQESAWMDGCSNFRMLMKIILPLSMPIIAVMMLYYGVAQWNSYFSALIYLRQHDMYPLQLILRELLIVMQSEIADTGDMVGLQDRVLMAESIKYAVIIVASVPVLLLYPFVQRYFVKGVMIGAVKG